MAVGPHLTTAAQASSLPSTCRRGDTCRTSRWDHQEPRLHRSLPPTLTTTATCFCRAGAMVWCVSSKCKATDLSWHGQQSLPKLGGEDSSRAYASVLARQQCSRRDPTTASSMSGACTSLENHSGLTESPRPPIAPGDHVGSSSHLIVRATISLSPLERLRFEGPHPRRLIYPLQRSSHPQTTLSHCIGANSSRVHRIHRLHRLAPRPPVVHPPPPLPLQNRKE
mmetsp:Transcript_35148/g.67975  ORF Transcript_35148/g.67975 Transcript_35148/m.67975 type:complete len:224 (+) Transcript_35148:1371-2042(+)